MHPYDHPLFLHFIVYFNDNEDYFECHEVLEEYWKSQPGFSKEHPLTGYILLSTGFYHWRRGNAAGAKRTLHKALRRFREMPEQFQQYKEQIAFGQLTVLLEERLALLEAGQTFRPFKLPVSAGLEEKALRAKTELTLLPKNSAAVIDKHMLRDRPHILSKRQEKKKGRY